MYVAPVDLIFSMQENDCKNILMSDISEHLSFDDIKLEPFVVKVKIAQN